MKHKTKVRGQERKPVALFSRPGPARWAAHRALYPLLAPRHAEEGDHLGPAPCARGLHHLGRPLRVRHLGCTLPSGLTAWTLHLGVGEVAVRAPVDTDRAAIGEVASEAALCHRGLDVGDDGALDGPGAESGVVAALCNDVHGLGGHVQRDGPLLQALLDPNQLQLRDLLEVCSPEGAEGDRLVDAVEELRPEDSRHGLLDRVQHLLLLLLDVCIVQVHAQLRDGLAPDVRGHDDDGVLEVHGAALGVRAPAVVQDLQEQAEDVGVGLLHLVEEDDAVRAAPHGLCELPALLVAHVAGWRPGEPRDRKLLHVLAHVDADDRLLGVEEPLGQRLGQLGFAHARGPQEEEGCDRPVGVAEAVAGALHRLGDCAHGVLLADEALVQLCLEVDEPLLVAHGHALQRDACLHGHHLLDVALRHLLSYARFLHLLHLLALLLQRGELSVLDLPGSVEVVLSLGLGQLALELFNLLPDLLQGVHLVALLAPLLLCLSLVRLEVAELDVDGLQTLQGLGV
mmetsp:Transcript_123260/g.359895  ORF Transcript_123260/g.359895 Transcript_123260/m.359895 type:complete len:512 (+) Transcript_123260:38-1573(+)